MAGPQPATSETSMMGTTISARDTLFLPVQDGTGAPLVFRSGPAEHRRARQAGGSRRQGGGPAVIARAEALVDGQVDVLCDELHRGVRHDEVCSAAVVAAETLSAQVE